MTVKKPQHLKLEEQRPHSWAFNSPPQWEFLGYKLERALDAEREGDEDKATQIYLELIESCPEYIPALNNMGVLFKKRGDLDAAIATFEEAVGIGLACLPADFEPDTDLIPWYWEDNRAFLLAYENLGICYLEKALDTFEHLQELNPGYRGIAGLVNKLRKVRGIEVESNE